MRRTKRALVATVAVAAIALAGCTGSGAESQSGEAGKSKGSAAKTLTDINEQPRDALGGGETLKFAITAMPASYNPLNVNGNTVDMSQVIGAFVLPQNWIYAGDGSFDVNPNYVESYELEDGDDSKDQTVTLNLNKQAKWGDGTPITWEDYEATWKACRGNETLIEDEQGDEDAEEVDEAEEEVAGDSVFLCASTDGYDVMQSIAQGEDEHQVVITYTDIYPDWASSLGSVSPKAGVEKAEVFNNGWQTPNNDWFAGPYRFASVDEAQQLITLEKNPAWWGEAGLLDEVTFKVLPVAEWANSFASGDIDVLTGIVDADQYLKAQTRSDGEIRRAAGTQWRQFTFNGEFDALEDENLRASLVRAIDRHAIAESDLAGIPDLDPSELVFGNHFFMPNQNGYVDNAEDYEFDPERAAKELESLGWVLDGDYRVKDGKTLEVEYMMMPEIPSSKNEGELLQAQLKDVGVKVTIRDVEPSVFFDEVREGRFGITAFDWQGTPSPLANIGQLYSCAQVAPDGQNYSRICSTKIDDLSRKVATEPNEEERLSLAAEVDRAIWENTMVLPLYHRIEMTAVPKGLANYGAFGLASVQAENVGFVK